ncbi:hypothetical protein I305_05764 [Cryptococcus gattii E566]|uniref:C2H2-type domain-containing protein n=2 Tax=Cryptococcus gattii TaxID=37769 RepID=E6RAD3_CRYGW|nr:Hypothetical Protein CGB_H0770C [Cryptococcus gattii WM276]ADV24181.1 Hypothetical Protein CGB_H0770C [Cryptococcus gattii WM276]KIR81500.1 hypothetical protein I306_01334 [Cryptococcus gattii EJB2]KIY31802.1 hypothetical protein I305_05764 [Cryptococcus gattii E566]KJE02241.1 hypothetical protein I311_04118 [Cryptococcus gattii NT-10]
MESDTLGFKCAHPGCEKSFTRKDHLLRHAANHSQTSYNCPICRREFKRYDLLQRHEKRNICGDDPTGSNPFKRPRSESSSQEEFSVQHAPPPPPINPMTGQLPDPSSFQTAIFPVASNSTAIPPNGTYDGSLQVPNSFNPHASDFSVEDIMGDWGFSLWAPEQWEALLHETLAPPFNEPMVDMPWDMPMLPRMQQQESAERGHDNVASAMLVARLQRSYPEFDVPLSWVIEALQTYWTRTAPTFPFIHRGTFDLDAAPTELVLMMAVVGSVHMAPRRDFSHLVQKIRGVLVQECGLDMPISTLQTFCLCHVHDTWYSTADSQFVAQCMWPVMVAHSRKKGIGVVGKPENEIHQEEAWAAWAKEEERRRAAYCVLLIDTQLSAFWNQHCSRQLSIFAHHLTLPCTRRQWEAPTAQEWFRMRVPPPNTPPTLRKSNARSGYLPGLHPEFQVSTVADGYSSAILAALALEKLSFKVDLENSLTVQMVLIGLIAIAWDCRTRGGMGIRFREGTKHWRSIVFKAVINMRATYEAEVIRMGDAIESRDLRDTFAICNISILSDIPMLCVAAGATTFCGSTIGPRQYSDAKRRLKLWVKTEDAWTCVWQCARYLRQALFADWGLYTPWAVFLTTLACRAYSWTSATAESTSQRRQHPTSYSTAHLSMVDRQATIIAWLDKILQTPGRHESTDGEVDALIEYVAGQLELGESVARENAAMLKTLIGHKR